MLLEDIMFIKLATYTEYICRGGIAVVDLGVFHWFSWKPLFKSDHYSATFVYCLKGQCVSMEAVQSQWFHWQWNHNETKGLRGFMVHAVDSRHYMRSTWKTTKVYRRMEQWKQTYLCFNETFVKRRKLRVDPSESVWYAVEQYSERTQQNVGMHVDNEPAAGMHS